MNNNYFTGWLAAFAIIINSLAFISYESFEYYYYFAMIGNSGIFVLIAVLHIYDKKAVFSNYFYLAMCFLYCFMSVLLTKGGPSSVHLFVLTLFILTVLSEISFSKLQIKCMSAALLATSLYWCSKVAYISGPDAADSINSNSVAMFFMFSAVYLVMFAKILNFKYIKSFSFIIFAVALIEILAYQARTTLIAFVLFLIMYYIVPIKFWQNKNAVKTIFISLIIGSFLFPAAYLFLNTSDIQYMVELYSSKSLYSGREDIWWNLIDSLLRDPSSIFIGLGSAVELWIGNNLNLHNASLAILVNFGLIGIVLFYACLFKFFGEIYKRGVQNEVQIIGVITILSFLIQAYSENVFLYYRLMLFNYLCFSLAINYREETEIIGEQT